MKLEAHKSSYKDLQKVNNPFPPNKNSLSDVNLDRWKNEIFSFLEEMETLHREDDEEIFMKLSSWSARASHIRSFLILDSSRSYQSFRTGIIDPFIQECDRQFKVLSRALSVKQMQWEMDSKL